MFSGRLIEIGATDGAPPHSVLELTDDSGERGLAVFIGLPAALNVDSAAVKNALLDLACRKVRMPQHVMLGGAIRAAVPVVAAIVIDPAAPDLALDRAARLLDELQTRFLSLHLPSDAARIAEIVDAFVGRYQADATVRLCLHGNIDDTRLGALQQGLRQFSLECCYAERALELGVTPAGLIVGGTATGALRELAPRAVLSAVSTDACTTGGPAALEVISAVARVFQLEVTLVAPIQSPLDLLANAHAAASGFAMHGGVEVFAVPDFSLFGASVADFLRNGSVVLNDAPGLGLRIDDAALRARGLASQPVTVR